MNTVDDAAHLTTEARNPASVHLNRLSTRELVDLMNREDSLVAPAVGSQAAAIARAIDAIVPRWQQGRRLIYLGAGTSGRLGVLDASECPPTFNTPPERVVGVIAGGTPALTRAVEGAEDRADLADADLAALRLTAHDTVVGITTSGRAAYVLRGIELARLAGALTIGIACNTQAKLNERVDIAIVPVVGPEVLSGSTRLKAGSATKMVLNMLSTGLMVKLGKTHGNLMIDLRATNHKLAARARRIVHTIAGITLDDAETLLNQCQGEVKTALVMHARHVNADDARLLLQSADGMVDAVLPVASPKVVANTELILGIDGGGSSTQAILAHREPVGYSIFGRGQAGPSNRQVVGDEVARANIQQAIHAAFAAAELPVQSVDVLCIGLAGADRPDDRQAFLTWATGQQLARRIIITNDADLVLAAGTPDGWGLAIIAGTGSIALGRNAQGETLRAGGWGPLLGDKGSAYAIAVDALQVAAIEVDTGLTLDGDEITPANALLPLFLKHWQLDDPRQLVTTVYGSSMDRRAIAKLAPLVLDAYQQGNTEPAELIENNAMHLAGDAAIVMRRLFGETKQVPIALAGGLLTHYPVYAEKVVELLRRCRASDENQEPLGPIQVVAEPAMGAVHLASQGVVSG